MDRKEMMAKAEDMGLEFAKNISNDNLATLIEDAEFAAKEAQYEKPTEESKKVVAEAKGKTDKVKQLSEAVIANIIPLKETMRDQPSEMYSVMTKNGTKKQVVKFNKDMVVFRCIVDMLREKTALIQSKSTGSKGQEIVRKVMSPAFAINTREATAEEIAELTGKK